MFSQHKGVLAFNAPSFSSKGRVMKRTVFRSAIAFLILGASQGAWGQVPTPRPVAEARVAQEVGDTSETSLDWSGVYQGVLTEPGHLKVETVLTLNSDHTYVMTCKAGDEKGEAKVYRGLFAWMSDGGSVLLNDVGDHPSMFKVGENQLFQLDDNAKLVKGPDEGRVVLRKTAEAAVPTLQGTRWELVELPGKDFPVDPEAKRPYLVFEKGAKVGGFAGCNQFGGKCAEKGDQQLKISQLVATKMACPELGLENAFMTSLEQVDRYKILGATLYLYQGQELLVELRVADPDV